MKQIDEQVWWKYVDGDCKPEERLRIESLLASDPSLAEEMMLRSALHHEMSDMELIAPGMDFTRNVMDSLPAKKAIRISKVAPLVSPRTRWSFLIVSVLLFMGLLTSPFFLEEGSAAAPGPDGGFPLIAKLSLWLDSVMASAARSLPALPDVRIPVIPNSFIQMVGVLVIGTLILLTIDKLAAKRMEEQIQL